MNPRLVEEVARAIYESMDLMDKLDTTAAEIYAQAAIRVCMARAAEIADERFKTWDGNQPVEKIEIYEARAVEAAALRDAIKREGGLT